MRRSALSSLRYGTSILALLAASLVAATPQAATVTATWDGGAGDWTADNWTFAPAQAALFPNNTATDFFNVRIDGGKAAASPVTLGSSITVDSVEIGANDSLSVGNGLLGLVRDAGRAQSGRLANAGLVELNGGAATSSSINLAGSVSFLGGGVVRLGGPANQVVFAPDNDPDTLQARAFIFGNGTLTNTNHTIAGSGSIGFFDLSLRNQAGGVIDANQAGAALVIASRDNAVPGGVGAVNLGTMRASDGGILRLFQGVYTQTTGGPGSGTIEALAGSTVHVENSTVEVKGGTLRTVGDGQLLVRQASVALDNVALENAGTLRLLPGTSGFVNFSANGGSIANSGTIEAQNAFIGLTNLNVGNAGQIALSTSGSGTSMSLTGNVSFGGGGALTLSGPANQVVFAPDNDPDTLQARAFIFGNATLTNSNHTIAGSGSIGFFDLSLRNQAGGVIDANQAGATLVIASRDNAVPGGVGAVNLGTMRASDGGILRLFQGVYTQTTGGPGSGTIEALAGSTVHVENSTVEVKGGTLRTVGDGQLLVRQASVALDNVALENAGTLRLLPGTAGFVNFSASGGSIANSGTIEAQNAFIGLTNLNVGNNGQIALSTSGSGTSLSLTGNVSFGGGGALTLSGPANQVVFAPDNDPDTLQARAFIFGNATLTNSNHTIAGSGSIGFFDLSLRNQAGGVIDANQAGATLVIASRDNAVPGGVGAVNLGTMRASDGGILRLFQGVYTQNTGGPGSRTIEALAGSTVHVENSQVEVKGGMLRTADGGQLLVRQASLLVSNAAIENAGLIDVKSNAFAQFADSSVTGGTIRVAADAFLQTSGASRVDGVAVQGNMSNVGALTVAAGGLGVSGTYAQTNGSTNLAGGTLQAGLIDIQAGSLTGNGTLVGPASINGTLQAGNSAGIMNFFGDVSLAGAIEVELAGLLVDGAVPLLNAINLGTDPLTTEFDQYNVFGVATLADGLEFDVALLGGFLPGIGSFFDVFTADDLVVNLAALVFDLPSFNGLTFDASIVSFDGREALRLTVVAAAVPEPGVLWLLLLGALGVAARRARR